jgi:hypothetical protein
METKRCSKCGETKAGSAFGKNGLRLRPDCKSCVNARSRAYYAAHSLSQNVRCQDYYYLHRNERLSSMHTYLGRQRRKKYGLPENPDPRPIPSAPVRIRILSDAEMEKADWRPLV